MHQKSLRHIIGPIKGSVGLGIAFNTQQKVSWSELGLGVYVDADLPNRGPATTGWIAQLVSKNGMCLALEWSSKRQAIATTSTAESELVALASAAKESLRIASVVDETMNNGALTKPRLYVDNDAARTIMRKGKSAKLQWLRKSVGLRFDMLSDLARDAIITVERVKTDENIADF